MTYSNKPSGTRNQNPLPRITGQYVLNEIVDVLSLKKGVLFTFKELLIRPSLSVKEFIEYDRNRLVKPVLFLIFSSLVYTLLQNVLGFEDGYIQYEVDDPKNTGTDIARWIQNNYGYTNIIMSIFVTAWTRLFFRKKGYNFFEVFVLILFVFGMNMLFYSAFGILESILQLKVLHIGAIISVVYSCWAIGSFFEPRKVFAYIKAFLSYFFGFMTFIIATTVVGILIDYFIS